MMWKVADAGAEEAATRTYGATTARQAFMISTPYAAPRQFPARTRETPDRGSEGRAYRLGRRHSIGACGAPAGGQPDGGRPGGHQVHEGYDLGHEGRHQRPMEADETDED